MFFRSLQWAVWVYVSNLPGPAAMIPMLSTLACFLAMSITIYHLFPANWRQEPAFASQLKWLIVAQLYMAGHMIVTNLFYNFVFFITLPSYLQWLAALALPAIREFSGYMLTAICRLAIQIKTVIHIQYLIHWLL